MADHPLPPSTQPPPRRLSGVAGFSRLSQKVTGVLKPTTSASATPATAAIPPPAVTAIPQVQNKLVVMSNGNGSSPDGILEQLKHYEREGFIPPRQCCWRRVSIGRVITNGPAVSFRISVFNNTSFEVILANGANATTVDAVTIRCENIERLTARGKAMTDPQTGIVSHPAFKPGSSLGGWLPHYAIGVLVYLLLRLVEDDGTEQDLANAAIGPLGFELSFATGIALVKGKRNTMEDYKLIYPPQRGVALFGVFDGHGGFSAAEYASKNIPVAFHSFLASPTPPFDHPSRALGIRRALKAAIEDTDKRFLAETKETAGSTVCVAAIDMETLVVHVANVGDTRCTLCREGKALDLSIDHKANHPAEIARIVDSNGFVARGRALGLLAISRALGDRDLKRSGHDVSAITAQADVDTFVLDPCRDEFIILGCDGLFDVMTSQQVVAFARNKFAEGLTEDAIAQSLASHAIDNLGSLDNVTVIVISLSWLFVGTMGSASSTPRAMRAATIRRTESATLRAAKASAHKRQTSRMSSTESSTSTMALFTGS